MAVVSQNRDMALGWFSASLRLVILVEGHQESSLLNEIVHVFQAEDWKPAFERAVELGKAHETEYVNGDGERVRWRLDRVLTLDLLSGEQLDGAEVYSALSDIEPGIAFDTLFRPESHQPGQTGI